MGLHNTDQRFGSAAMALHWLIALNVIGLLAVGKFMTGEGLDLSTKFQLYQLHKSFGVLVFVLMIARLCWRWTQIIPAYPETMRPWEKTGAHISHWGFYVLLIVMPLTGWALVSAATFKVPTLLFGTIPLPHLTFLENTADPKATEEWVQWIHTTLGWVIIGIVVVHVGAALKHHFIDRDTVLTRMLPGRGRNSS